MREYKTHLNLPPPLQPNARRDSYVQDLIAYQNNPAVIAQEYMRREQLFARIEEWRQATALDLHTGHHSHCHGLSDPISRPATAGTDVNNNDDEDSSDQEWLKLAMP